MVWKKERDALYNSKKKTKRQISIYNTRKLCGFRLVIYNYYYRYNNSSECEPFTRFYSKMSIINKLVVIFHIYCSYKLQLCYISKIFLR